MIRFLTLLLTSVLAFGSTSAAVATVPTVSDDVRVRTCTYMCAQSTLPEIARNSYFVNGDRDLLQFGETSISLRNLDTGKVTATVGYPTGVSFWRSAISRDGSVVYFLGTTDSGNVRILRVNLTTLELTAVTPSGASYGITSEDVWEFAVAPDNVGFYMVQSSGGSKYLCRFSQTGAQQACSSAFANPTNVSHIFFDSTNEKAYVLGNSNQLFNFTVSDMSFTATNLDGVASNFQFSAQSFNEKIFFADPLWDSNFPSTTSVYRVSLGGTLSRLDIPGAFSVTDIVAPRNGYWSIYLMGTYKTGATTWSNANSLLKVNTYDTMSVMDEVSFPRKGGIAQSLAAIDSWGRYVVASGYQVASKIVPVSEFGSVEILFSTTYDSGSAKWTIHWNFINVVPKKRAKSYQVRYLAPGATKWKVIATVAAGGAHSCELSGVESGGLVKVVPKGVSTQSESFAVTL